MSGEERISFARPVVDVGNATVLSPLLQGTLRRGGMLKAKVASFLIKYNCLTPGVSTVKVTLPFANPQEGEDEKVPVSFMWSIECESNAREGFTVQRPKLATSTSLASTHEEIAADGKAEEKWKVIQYGLSGEMIPFAEPKDLFSVGGDTNTTRFLVGMTMPTKGNRKSIQQAFRQPKLSVKPEGIASPVFLGTGRKGGTVRAAAVNSKSRGQGTKVLDIKYNCIAIGDVTVTVTIPFPDNNFKPVIFTWKKTCGGGLIKDLMMADAYDEPVVAGGEVMPAWSPISGDHSVDSSETSSTFKLTKRRGSKRDTRFQTPVITAEPSKTCNPSLDGNGRKGGTIKAGRNADPSEISVIYNCVERGEVTITMTIPFAMNPDVVISWQKSCGGVARPYFSVMTWESPVVKDGVTYDDWSPEFVGEPFAALVDSSEDETQLYIGLEAKDESNAGFYEPDWSDWMDDVESPSIPPNLMSQTYQRPMVETSNPSICNPSLSNMASKGGTVTSYGDDQQLDVTYHCLRPGKAVVTVTVPIGVYEPVVFSWTKTCKKSFVEGLSVGTDVGADDVVSDGHAAVFFDTSPDAEGRRMVVDKDSGTSTFYVMVDPGVKPMAFDEPVVTANPPICSPRVSGEMRKGGQITSKEGMQLTVRYNCAVGGSTVITMRIPLEDDSLETITWAWRKNNGPAPAVQSAIDHENHYDSSEVMSLLVLVVGLMAVVYCISGKLGGKNETNKGFSRLPQHDTWGMDTSKKH